MEKSPHFQFFHILLYCEMMAHILSRLSANSGWSFAALPHIFSRSRTSSLLSIWQLLYNGLRGIASPVLTATGFVNGRWQFSTPTESTPLDQSPKKLVQVITSAAPTAVTNLVQIRPRGASGQMGEI